MSDNSTQSLNFNIPKLKRESSKGNLRPVKLTSHEAVELLQTVQRSYLDASYHGQWEVKHVQMVDNREMEKEYSKKRIEMKDDGRSARELTEHYGYRCLRDNITLSRIARDGYKAKLSSYNALGKSTCGVYVSRHPDVELRHMEYYREVQVMVFKVIFGRCKSIPLSHQGTVEPTPNFDCHLSNRPAQITDSFPVQYNFSQVYIYEYNEDALPSTKPRQCLPYAVLHMVKKTPSTQSAYNQPRSAYQRSLAPDPPRTPMPRVQPAPRLASSKDPEQVEETVRSPQGAPAIAGSGASGLLSSQSPTEVGVPGRWPSQSRGDPRVLGRRGSSQDGAPSLLNVPLSNEALQEGGPCVGCMYPSTFCPIHGELVSRSRVPGTPVVGPVSQQPRPSFAVSSSAGGFQSASMSVLSSSKISPHGSQVLKLVKEVFGKAVFEENSSNQSPGLTPSGNFLQSGVSEAVPSHGVAVSMPPVPPESSLEARFNFGKGAAPSSHPASAVAQRADLEYRPTHSHPLLRDPNKADEVWDQNVAMASAGMSGVSMQDPPGSSAASFTPLGSAPVRPSQTPTSGGEKASLPLYLSEAAANIKSGDLRKILDNCASEPKKLPTPVRNSSLYRLRKKKKSDMQGEQSASSTQPAVSVADHSQPGTPLPAEQKQASSEMPQPILEPMCVAEPHDDLSVQDKTAVPISETEAKSESGKLTGSPDGQTTASSDDTAEGVKNPEKKDLEEGAFELCVSSSADNMTCEDSHAVRRERSKSQDSRCSSGSSSNDVIFSEMPREVPLGGSGDVGFRASDRKGDGHLIPDSHSSETPRVSERFRDLSLSHESHGSRRESVDYLHKRPSSDFDRDHYDSCDWERGSQLSYGSDRHSQYPSQRYSRSVSLRDADSLPSSRGAPHLSRTVREYNHRSSDYYHGSSRRGSAPGQSSGCESERADDYSSMRTGLNYDYRHGRSGYRRTESLERSFQERRVLLKTPQEYELDTRRGSVNFWQNDGSLDGSEVPESYRLARHEDWDLRQSQSLTERTSHGHGGEVDFSLRRTASETGVHGTGLLPTPGNPYDQTWHPVEDRREGDVDLTSENYGGLIYPDAGRIRHSSSDGGEEKAERRQSVHSSASWTCSRRVSVGEQGEGFSSQYVPTFSSQESRLLDGINAQAVEVHNGNSDLERTVRGRAASDPVCSSGVYRPLPLDDSTTGGTSCAEDTAESRNAFAADADTLISKAGPVVLADTGKDGGTEGFWLPPATDSQTNVAMKGDAETLLLASGEHERESLKGLAEKDSTVVKLDKPAPQGILLQTTELDVISRAQGSAALDAADAKDEDGVSGVKMKDDSTADDSDKTVDMVVDSFGYWGPPADLTLAGSVSDVTYGCEPSTEERPLEDAVASAQTPEKEIVDAAQSPGRDENAVEEEGRTMPLNCEKEDSKTDGVEISLSSSLSNSGGKPKKKKPHKDLACYKRRRKRKKNRTTMPSRCSEESVTGDFWPLNVSECGDGDDFYILDISGDVPEEDALFTSDDHQTSLAAQQTDGEEKILSWDSPVLQPKVLLVDIVKGPSRGLPKESCKVCVDTSQIPAGLPSLNLMSNSASAGRAEEPVAATCATSGTELVKDEDDGTLTTVSCTSTATGLVETAPQELGVICPGIDNTDRFAADVSDSSVSVAMADSDIPAGTFVKESVAAGSEKGNYSGISLANSSLKLEEHGKPSASSCVSNVSEETKDQEHSESCMELSSSSAGCSADADCTSAMTNGSFSPARSLNPQLSPAFTTVSVSTAVVHPPVSSQTVCAEGICTNSSPPFSSTEAQLSSPESSIPRMSPCSESRFSSHSQDAASCVMPPNANSAAAEAAAGDAHPHPEVQALASVEGGNTSDPLIGKHSSGMTPFGQHGEIFKNSTPASEESGTEKMEESGTEVQDREGSNDVAWEEKPDGVPPALELEGGNKMDQGGMLEKSKSETCENDVTLQSTQDSLEALSTESNASLIKLEAVYHDTMVADHFGVNNQAEPFERKPEGVRKPTKGHVSELWQKWKSNLNKRETKETDYHSDAGEEKETGTTYSSIQYSGGAWASSDKVSIPGFGDVAIQSEISSESSGKCRKSNLLEDNGPVLPGNISIPTIGDFAGKSEIPSESSEECRKSNHMEDGAPVVFDNVCHKPEDDGKAKSDVLHSQPLPGTFHSEGNVTDTGKRDVEIVQNPLMGKQESSPSSIVTEEIDVVGTHTDGGVSSPPKKLSIPLHFGKYSMQRSKESAGKPEESQPVTCVDLTCRPSEPRNILSVESSETTLTTARKMVPSSSTASSEGQAIPVLGAATPCRSKQASTATTMTASSSSQFMGNPLYFGATLPSQSSQSATEASESDTAAVPKAAPPCPVKAVKPSLLGDMPSRASTSSVLGQVGSGNLGMHAAPPAQGHLLSQSSPPAHSHLSSVKQSQSSWQPEVVGRRIQTLGQTNLPSAPVSSGKSAYPPATSSSTFTLPVPTLHTVPPVPIHPGQRAGLPCPELLPLPDVTVRPPPPFSQPLMVQVNTQVPPPPFLGNQISTLSSFRGTYPSAPPYPTVVSAAPGSPMPAAGLVASGHMVSQPGHIVTQSGHVISQPGHMVAQSGHMVAQPGHVISQPGHMVAQPGHVISQPGHMVTQSGHVISQPGHMVAQPGRMAAQPGHMATQSGHMVSHPGHMMSQPRQTGYVISQGHPGHMASQQGQPGHMVSPPGHMVSQPGHMLSHQGHMVSPPEHMAPQSYFCSVQQPPPPHPPPSGISTVAPSNLAMSEQTGIARTGQYGSQGHGLSAAATGVVGAGTAPPSYMPPSVPPPVGAHNQPGNLLCVQSSQQYSPLPSYPPAPLHSPSQPVKCDPQPPPQSKKSHLADWFSDKLTPHKPVSALDELSSGSQRKRDRSPDLIETFIKKPRSNRDTDDLWAMAFEGTPPTAPKSPSVRSGTVGHEPEKVLLPFSRGMRLAASSGPSERDATPERLSPYSMLPQGHQFDRVVLSPLAGGSAEESLTSKPIEYLSKKREMLLSALERFPAVKKPASSSGARQDTPRERNLRTLKDERSLPRQDGDASSHKEETSKVWESEKFSQPGDCRGEGREHSSGGNIVHVQSDEVSSTLKDSLRSDRSEQLISEETAADRKIETIPLLLTSRFPGQDRPGDDHSSVTRRSRFDVKPAAPSSRFTVSTEAVASDFAVAPEISSPKPHTVGLLQALRKSFSVPDTSSNRTTSSGGVDSEKMAPNEILHPESSSRKIFITSKGKSVTDTNQQKRDSTETEEERSATRKVFIAGNSAKSRFPIRGFNAAADWENASPKSSEKSPDVAKTSQRFQIARETKSLEKREKKVTIPQETRDSDEVKFKGWPVARTTSPKRNHDAVKTKPKEQSDEKDPAPSKSCYSSEMKPGDRSRERMVPPLTQSSEEPKPLDRSEDRKLSSPGSQTSQTVKAIQLPPVPLENVTDDEGSFSDDSNESDSCAAEDASNCYSLCDYIQYKLMIPDPRQIAEKLACPLDFDFRKTTLAKAHKLRKQCKTLAREYFETLPEAKRPVNFLAVVIDGNEILGSLRGSLDIISSEQLERELKIVRNCIQKLNSCFLGSGPERAGSPRSSGVGSVCIPGIGEMENFKVKTLQVEPSSVTSPSSEFDGDSTVRKYSSHEHSSKEYRNAASSSQSRFSRTNSELSSGNDVELDYSAFTTDLAPRMIPVPGFGRMSVDGYLLNKEALEQAEGDVLDALRFRTGIRSHQKLPKELLTAREQEAVFSEEDCFLYLICSLPKKPYLRLLGMKKQLECLNAEMLQCVMQNRSSDLAVIKDRRKRVHDERNTLMTTFTGRICRKRIRRLTTLKIRYRLLLDFLQTQLAPDAAWGLTFLRTQLGAISNHLQVVQQEMASSLPFHHHHHHHHHSWQGYAG